ncbi:hypothetical protein GEV33_004693 [Tenebrio molitor]|uniref:Uncharacterized protein n=1 Tax=Tenebrio molitor TaxID=7067 RepID=A0A8J6HQB1_TENMO|nr:hypothetical protein GEV33_004693 [Tenebrio molitor]
MAFGRSNVSRNRNSWGPMSVPTGFHRPEPDEEFAEEYTERMMSAQMRQLDPLKEDLADWINKTLGKWWNRSLFRWLREHDPLQRSNNKPSPEKIFGLFELCRKSK